MNNQYSKFRNIIINILYHSKRENSKGLISTKKVLILDQAIMGRMVDQQNATFGKKIGDKYRSMR